MKKLFLLLLIILRFSSFVFAQSDRPPTRIDFDGDGKDDMAIFRPSNGTWNIIRSRDGFTAAHFGLRSDTLAPLNHDHPGSSYIAVFRQSRCSWYMLSTRTV